LNQSKLTGNFEQEIALLWGRKKIACRTKLFKIRELKEISSRADGWHLLCVIDRQELKIKPTYLKGEKL